MEIALSNFALTTLKAAKYNDESNADYLIGYWDGEKLCILSPLRIFLQKKNQDFSKEILFIRSHVPAGLMLVGLHFRYQDGLNESISKDLQTKVNMFTQLFDHPICEKKPKILVMCTDGEGKTLAFAFERDSSSNNFKIGVKVEVESSNSWDSFGTNYILVHSQLSIPINLAYSDGKYKEAIKDEFKEIKSKIESSNITFHFPKNNLTISNVKTHTNYSKQWTDFIKTSKKNSENGIQIIDGLLLTNQSSDNNGKSTSPFIFYKNCENLNSGKTNLNFSLVSYSSIKETLGETIDKLLGSIKSQLDYSISLLESDDSFKFQISSFQYQPSKYPHVITVIYPILEGVTLTDKESYLLEKRKELHLRFGLSMNRPSLRIPNAIDFAALTSDSDSEKQNERIREVHSKLGLQSQISGGKQYLIEGGYDYYHYMQDNFNDNGWGCAYRSMQTICSWIQLQHYTNKDVPSHKDIQKVLVDMGDKEKSFINSTNWIGAIEISMCLQNLYGINCSILHVSNGSELAQKGRELARHFETQGSPVMIGGGVLAYTLLGIDYNEKSGDIRFLILDPHYTGAENLKTIKEKGWCGWKTVDIFRKDSFYNLCLPQRPSQI